MSKLRLYTKEELALRNKGLQEIKNTLDTLGIKFLLFDGVLLGAVREGGFIKWDWDVELALFAEQATKKVAIIGDKLASTGFEIGTVDKRPTNLKINAHKYGTKYSMVGFYEDGALRRREQWKYPKSFFDNLEYISFLGADYLCPSPPTAYLEYQYGDWRTPKKEREQSRYLMNRIYVRNNWIDRLRKLFRHTSH